MTSLSEMPAAFHATTRLVLRHAACSLVVGLALPLLLGVAVAPKLELATLYDGCFSLPTLPEVFLELHVPYYPLADISMDRAIVFRPRPNETAVLYLLAKADDGLLQELVHGQGSPLSGEVVCEHMFGASPPRPPSPSPPQTGNGDEVDAGPEEFSALDESGSEQ